MEACRAIRSAWKFVREIINDCMEEMDGLEEMEMIAGIIIKRAMV